MESEVTVLTNDGIVIAIHDPRDGDLDTAVKNIKALCEDN